MEKVVLFVAGLYLLLGRSYRAPQQLVNSPQFQICDCIHPLLCVCRHRYQPRVALATAVDPYISTCLISGA